MISVENLSYHISDKIILNKISFTAKAGELISLVGPNGTGKTSLMNCLSAITDDFQGIINYNDNDITQMSSIDRAKVLSHVSQGAMETSPFSVYEFMSYARFPYMDGFRALSDIEEVLLDNFLMKFDCHNLKDKRMDQLSGGERQRVFLASTFFQDTPVVLLDEPTSFLDPYHSDLVMSILVDEANKGKLIIVITHDLNSAAVNASRIIALKEGYIQFDGQPSEFMDEKLDELYNLEFSKTMHNSSKVILPRSFK